MKRDMELIRTILLAVEESTRPEFPVIETPDGYDDQTFYYHVYLMTQAQLLEAIDTGGIGSIEYRIKSMTWQGHEFLDAVRQDTVWEQTKGKLGGQIASAGFEIIKGVANGLITQKLKEMGVPIG